MVKSKLSQNCYYLIPLLEDYSIYQTVEINSWVKLLIFLRSAVLSLMAGSIVAFAMLTVLKSSLERAVVDRFGMAWDDVPEIERDSLKISTPTALYGSDVSIDNPNLMELLAIMQHYEALPILDWTYSFYRYILPSNATWR
jgi:hypothetical protein